MYDISPNNNNNCCPGSPRNARKLWDLKLERRANAIGSLPENSTSSAAADDSTTQRCCYSSSLIDTNCIRFLRRRRYYRGLGAEEKKVLLRVYGIDFQMFNYSTEGYFSSDDQAMAEAAGAGVP